MSNDQVVIFDGADPKMHEANQKARETFKYFWRELSWEYRRIIPALGLAAVKVKFSDENVSPENPNVEEMWVNNINFDGSTITGVLLNSPNWLQNIKAGDNVEVPISEISDWMYSIHDKVYGGFTVNLIRERLSSTERQSHDEAWGLNFGDPTDLPIVYTDEKATQEDYEKALIEHPMCINMGASLLEDPQQLPQLLNFRDSAGNSMLHLEALAGNTMIAKILLDNGADPNLKNHKAQTPLDLAKLMHWEHVIALF